MSPLLSGRIRAPNPSVERTPGAAAHLEQRSALVLARQAVVPFLHEQSLSR
jgi:hypothetical protein